MGARAICNATFNLATMVTSSHDHGGCFVSTNGVLHLPGPAPQWDQGARRQAIDPMTSTPTWIFLKNMLPGKGERYSNQQFQRLYREASSRPVSTDYYLALSFKNLLHELEVIETVNVDTNMGRPLTKIEVRDLLLYGGQSWVTTDQKLQVEKLPVYTTFQEIRARLKMWEAELFSATGAPYMFDPINTIIGHVAPVDTTLTGEQHAILHALQYKGILSADLLLLTLADWNITTASPTRSPTLLPTTLPTYHQLLLADADKCCGVGFMCGYPRPGTNTRLCFNFSDTSTTCTGGGH